MNTPSRNSRFVSTVRRGFSLVEGLIVLAVASVIAGSVLPSFKAAIERRHLEGAAAQLVTDVMYTRSLAVAQDRALRISFRSDAAGACYVVHSGAASDCRCATGGGATACTRGAQAIKTSSFVTGSAVSVQSNVGSIVFHPLHGTSTPAGTLRVVSRSGAAVHQVVNIMGRVRACTPNSVAGYPRC